MVTRYYPVQLTWQEFDSYWYIVTSESSYATTQVHQLYGILQENHH